MQPTVFFSTFYLGAFDVDLAILICMAWVDRGGMETGAPIWYVEKPLAWPIYLFFQY